MIIRKIAIAFLATGIFQLIIQLFIGAFMLIIGHANESVPDGFIIWVGIGILMIILGGIVFIIDEFKEDIKEYFHG